MFRCVPADIWIAKLVKAYFVVEDDEDIRGLIRMTFRRTPEFVIAGEAESAEEALVMLRSMDVSLIVLDHGLTGVLTGLDAAPLFKEILPQTKIILFTADPVLRVRASNEWNVDAFLIKTEFAQLLPTALRLCGIGSPSE